MEHSVVPLIPILLDKPRHLRLDIAALCLAERDLCEFWGKDVSVYSALLKNPPSLNDMSILVLHGLRHEDPTLSLPEVRGMLNHSTIGEVFQSVTDAWTKATQAAEPEPEGTTPVDPQPVLTGGSSGPTPATTWGSVTQTSGI